MDDCKRSSSVVRSGAARRWLAGVVAGLAVLLAGCATPLRGQLTAFHEWPADAPRTYQFARTAAQRDSLEHATWEQVMRAELARAGFREAANPRFSITFDYRVSRQLGRVVEALPGKSPRTPVLASIDATRASCADARSRIWIRSGAKPPEVRA